jgi:hypothetical protein
MSRGSRGFLRQSEGGPLAGRQAEGDARLRQGDLLDDVVDGKIFRPLASEELEPGRGGREQLAHLNACAAGNCCRAQRCLVAAIHHDLVRIIPRPRTRCQRQVGNGANRRQGLAAEAQRRDIEKVFLVEL